VSDELFGAPAGWYPDPLGLPQLRWWNNHAWTEQTSAARQPMVVQDTKFAWADDEVPTRRDELFRERASADRRPAEPSVPTADSLRELEPPRAFTQVGLGAPSAPVAEPTPVAQPVAPAAAADPFAFASQPVAPAAAPDPFAFASQPFPPAAPQAAETVTAPSLYTPDPVVEAPIAGHSGPSLDTIFDARPAAAPAEALDALFGEKETRRAGTRVKTPIVTIDHVAVTATPGAAKPSSTAPAWIIAMIPLFQLVVSLLLVTSLGMSGSQFIYIGILVVPYFAVIVLAYFDNKALRAAGHKHVAHWGWAALGAPVYLLVRARSVIRETGHGIGPVLVWFALGILHVASAIAVPGVIIALLPAVFTAQIESSVASDAWLIAQSQMTVSCEGNAPVIPTADRIVCESVDDSGNTFDITVMLVRSNGWIDWQVVDWGSFGK